MKMKVKKKHLIGEIADFPKYVVQAMCDEQMLQGKPFAPSVFANSSAADFFNGGFNWAITEQGEDFWENVIIRKKFDLITKPEKPKGHPQAKLMKKYAKDAKRHERPWELWEYETASGCIWLDCTCSPSWDSTVKYRRKQNTAEVEKH